MNITKEILQKSLKGLAHILCLTLFIIYTVSIFKMYLEEYTATLVDIMHDDEIEVPIITICAEQPLKKKILPLSDQDFMKMTYDLEDLIAESTLKVNGNWMCYKSMTNMSILGF